VPPYAEPAARRACVRKRQEIAASAATSPQGAARRQPSSAAFADAMRRFAAPSLEDRSSTWRHAQLTRLCHGVSIISDGSRSMRPSRSSRYIDE